MKKTHPRNHPQGRIVPTSIIEDDEESRGSVSIMRKKIHRLEDILKQQEYEITTLKQLLISQSVDEHWQVPG